MPTVIGGELQGSPRVARLLASPPPIGGMRFALTAMRLTW